MGEPAADLAYYITVEEARRRLHMARAEARAWLRERDLIRIVGRTRTGKLQERVYLAALAAAMEKAFGPAPKATQEAHPASGRRPARTLEQLSASARGR